MVGSAAGGARLAGSLRPRPTRVLRVSPSGARIVMLGDVEFFPADACRPPSGLDQKREAACRGLLARSPITP